MADLQSSIAQAKQAGYSGDEIISYLSKARPELSPKIQQARSAGYSVNDIVSHLSSSAPAPSAPADEEGFIHATVRKTADKMNVENLLGAISQADSAAGRGDYKGAWEAIKQLNPINGLKAVAHDVMHGNASDIASDILPVAGLVDGVSGGRLSGAAGDAASRVADVSGKVADATGKYGARVAENTPAVGRAAVNVGKAAAPNLGKAVAANFIPGIGHPISVGMLFHTAAQLAKGGTIGELTNAIGGILKPTKAEIMESSNARAANTPWKSIPDPVQGPEVAPTEVDATLPSGRQAGGIQNQKDISPRPLGARQAPAWKGIPDTQPVTSAAPTTPQQPVRLPSGRVIGKPNTDAAQPLPTAKVQIPTKFSAASTTDTAGTSAPKPAPAAPDLNAVTVKRLAEATQTGKLEALAPADKAALVKAVKAGDSEAVHSILDKHGAVDRTRQAVIDKVQVLAKYAQDHGIDLESIAPADRQALANAAWAHGSKNGLTVPKSGYRGISDDTYNMIRDKVAGQ